MAIRRNSEQRNILTLTVIGSGDWITIYGRIGPNGFVLMINELLKNMFSELIVLLSIFIHKMNHITKFGILKQLTDLVI